MSFALVVYNTFFMREGPDWENVTIHTIRDGVKFCGKEYFWGHYFRKVFGLMVQEITKMP